MAARRKQSRPIDSSRPSISSIKETNRTGVPALRKGDDLLLPDQLTSDEKELDVEVAPSDIEALYAALTAPVHHVAVHSGPATTVASKLSAEHLSSLRSSIIDLEAPSKQQTDLEIQRERLTSSLSVPGAIPSLQQLTQLVHINALAGRPAEAQKAFDYIAKFGMKPDAVAFNSLLDAHARRSSLDEAIGVFANMQAAGIEPDLVAYSTLIKACIAHKDLNAGFKLYMDMRDQGLHPNQIVFTTLIKGCVDANDTARAWKTFNFMRTEISQPDDVAFNLMIYVCARDQNPERALDLFQEMTDRGMAVSEVTFTALIQACASRKDYYADAFGMLEQMAAKGLLPTMHTYNVLLSSAAKHGDVIRGRLVWNDLVARQAEMQETLKSDPNAADPSAVRINQIEPMEYSFAAMLRLYATALRLHLKGVYDNKDGTQTDSKSDSTSTPATPATTTALKVVESTSPTGFPILTSVETTPESFIREADVIWNAWQTLPQYESKRNSSHVLIARLRQLCQDPSPDAFERALTFWQNTKQALGPSVYLFVPMIQAAMRNAATVDRGTEIWKEMLEWDASVEQALVGQEGGQRLTETEKESVRVKQGRGRDALFRAFLMVADGYARANKIDHAIKTLYATTVFRHPYYLPAVHFRDIPLLVTKAQENADNGNWRLMEEITTLCPPLTDPLTQIQHILQQKTMPTGAWWGWKVLGYDRHQLAMLKRKQEREHVKIVQRTEAYRQKAATLKSKKPDYGKVVALMEPDLGTPDLQLVRASAAKARRVRQKSLPKKALVPKAKSGRVTRRRRLLSSSSSLPSE
eukprot:jgi/Hompol1/4542/HPOL_003725-RA